MSNSAHLQIEQQLRKCISNSIGEQPYRMWFSDTEFHCDKEQVNFVAATPLAAGWITDRFAPTLQNATNQIYGKEIAVHISSKEKACAGRASTNTGTNAKLSKSKPKQTKRNLMQFEDFIVGSCNQLAWTAAKQITTEEGKTISPLFIHGLCGVGKTHLLQAICHQALKTTSKKVRYVTAEQFTNEFIASSRTGEFARFRTRYRNLDLLAIDDVHFVANKTKTQEELLHTIDTADLRGTKLVLASDADPRLIRSLNQSLSNRFVAGMIAEVKRPDRNTRCKIIQKLCMKFNISMSKSAMDHLAGQAVGSVREIEGAVTRLKATASLLMNEANATIGIDGVERLLRKTPPTMLPIRMAHIIEVTAKRAALSPQDLKGSSRAARIVFWRSIATYLGRTLTTSSYPELAKALGRKNHSTAHATVKRITAILDSASPIRKINSEDIDVRETIDQLTWAVRSKANESVDERRS